MKNRSGSVTPGVVGIVAAALVIGALGMSAGGYAYLTLRAAPAAEESRRPIAARPAADGSASEVARLRLMLEEKETVYSRLRDQYEQFQRQATNTAAPVMRRFSATNSTARAGGDGNESSMDRWKRENPERYKQIQQQQEQRRQQVEARYQEQAARLQDRRRQAQSPDEIALLDQLTQTVGKLHEIGQGWESLSAMAGDDRATQMRQLSQDSMTTYQTYGELLVKDRQLQLSQLAAQVGYRDPAQAAQFTEAIQRIYTETDPGLNRLLGRGRMFSVNSGAISISATSGVGQTITIQNSP